MPGGDRGIIDIHAHILPGIDDGARDMEETLELIRNAYDQGVRTVIATPHYHYRKYRTAVEDIRILTEKVQTQARKIADDLEVYPGQEIFYADGVAEKLEQGELLTLAGTRYVLIEFYPESSFDQIYQAVRRLSRRGYVPVLAHVERYTCLRKEGAAEDLIHAGACMQVNYGSLVGLRDLGSRNWCRRMIKEDMISFLGTDMHRRDFRPPRLNEALKWLSGKLGEEEAIRLTRDNPETLLENRYLF